MLDFIEQPLLVKADKLTDCTIWFLTGHGPFRTSRGYRGGDKSCRFCSKSRELPEHLLFDCESLLEFRLEKENMEIEDFERSIRGIVNQMFKQR